MARSPWGRASDIFAYPSRHGGRERGTEAGEGEKGVPGGHALSLYNIVSFPRNSRRKEKYPKPRRVTLRVPRAIDFSSLPKYDSPPQTSRTSVTRRETCISNKYIVWMIHSGYLQIVVNSGRMQESFMLSAEERRILDAYRWRSRIDLCVSEIKKYAREH